LNREIKSGRKDTVAPLTDRKLISIGVFLCGRKNNEKRGTEKARVRGSYGKKGKKGEKYVRKYVNGQAVIQPHSGTGRSRGEATIQGGWLVMYT